MKKFILLGAVALTSCTSVKVFSPNPAIEPPELRGDRGVKISAELVGDHETKATDDGNHRPPDMAHPSTNTAFDLFPGATYAPIDELEAGLEFSPLHGGIAGIVRWQPIGEGARKAEEGNVPVAFYIKVGQGEAKTDATDNFGIGDFRGTIRESYVHGGVSSGYRIAPHFLVYGGAAYGQYWMRAEVDQDNPNNVYVGYSTGNGITAGGGLFCDWRVVQFFVSGEVTRLQYAGADTRTDPYLHAGIYITPGGGSSKP
jgi:hypothetical protein